MRKKLLPLALMLALCANLLAVPVLAAEKTLYLDGYSYDSDWNLKGTIEASKEDAQISLSGDLERIGSVVYPDFYEYTSPVYASKGPVTAVVIGSVSEGDPLSGQNEFGDFWWAVGIAGAEVSTVTYDAANQTFETVAENAAYFDGTVVVEDENENLTKVGTVQDLCDGKIEWDTYIPWILNGATVTLSQPGTYRIHVYYEALEGMCEAFVVIGEDGESASSDPAPSDPTPSDPTPSDPTPAAPAFTDVSASAYYAEPVAWAVEKGITAGATDTTFNPSGLCSRAHIITFLWRAAGSPEPSGTDLPADVDSGAYYAKAVQWAMENGIAESGDAFDPGAPCTRAMAVEFMWKYAGSPSATPADKFTDVSGDYAQAVQWALENGVTNGATDTTFGPDNTCTRAQIVTFLYRAYA